MFNYIKSELYRLKHKKGSYIYFAIIFALFTAMTLDTVIDSNFNVGLLLEMMLVMIPIVVPLFIGTHVLMAVVTDDLSAHTLPMVISAGLSRLELIVSKMIVALIYFGEIMLVCAGYYVLIGLLGRVPIMEILNSFSSLAPVVFAQTLFFLAILALTTTVAYTFQKTAPTIIVFILFAVGFIDQIGSLISLVIPNLQPFLTYFPMTLVNTLASDYLNQQGWSLLYTGILCAYLVAGFTITYIGFSRKEIKGD